ncbi:MAG: ABC transporter ATP-binding protein YtrB [Firmicutes bacterium ADurb.Bin419]|nr:MAG: ABC transporter ATP-binding protein YtrB [Firmicutes bacterium ADurb.Bin419]
MSVIQVKDDTKYYGKLCAIENISVSIEPGKIYGLLGRNGVGKTTLQNLMTNRLFPNSGEIMVDGESITENDRVLEKMFLMTEKNLYPESFKVKDIFYWTKEFYSKFDLEYAEVLCEKFELNKNKKFKSLSIGYKTISKIITALASNAEIMMFDEPVLGLDANHRELFYKELLANFMEEPKTIILSTHIIEEIAKMLDRVIIINARKIVIDDSTENLLKSAYCVSGMSQNVDKYIEGKTCVNIEQMTSFSFVIHTQYSSQGLKE